MIVKGGVGQGLGLARVRNWRKSEEKRGKKRREGEGETELKRESQWEEKGNRKKKHYLIGGSNKI